MPAKNHIDLVVKTLAVLEVLAANEFGKPLNAIAEEVSLVKSSAFRILYTLKETGYVEQPETNGVYRLTLKSAGLLRNNAKSLGLATVARPHLIGLRDELDESVALGERRTESVILVDVIETSHPLRLTIHIGYDCPIHATALGKAVAAFLPPKDLTKLLGKSKLSRYTEHTNTKMRDLKLALARARETGYTVNDEETVVGIYIVGAPLFDSQSKVCGAISVNVPTARCSPARKKQLIGLVIDVGKTISTDLRNIGFIH